MRSSCCQVCAGCFCAAGRQWPGLPRGGAQEAQEVACRRRALARQAQVQQVAREEPLGELGSSSCGREHWPWGMA